MDFSWLRTRVFQTRLAPGGGVTAITLFGLVFTRDRSMIDKRVLNHETIHCAQQLEWLYIPFFILYGIEWLIGMAKYRNSYQAYVNISFEREAYDNDRNFGYLSRRPLWANYRKKNKRDKHQPS